MSDPFAGFRDNDAPTNDGMAKLDTLIQELQDSEASVLAAESALKYAQAIRDTLVEQTIPEYMADELGLEEVKTRAGLMVKVTKSIRASMGKHKSQCLAWLEKNGHGGLIKRSVAVAFNRDEQESAAALAAKLSTDYDVRTDMKVEASTLAAFVREQLEAGIDVPSDIFGIFEQRKVKVTRPKIKK